MSGSLLLRRRKDGKLYLDMDKPPKEHSFSEHWVMERALAGEVSVDGDTLTLLLAKGKVEYRVVERDSANDVWHCKLKK